MNKIFLERFPFCYEYFSTLLNQVLKQEKKFPQGLIFEGSDTYLQYLFTLELARILNCQKEENKASFDCDCLNCKWIRSYSHPEVNLVSQIHYKGEGDETKTLISTKQALKIENSLSLSSDYHRFFIFISSHEAENQNQNLEIFSLLNYKTDFNYSIEPLNYQTFHPAAINALLKSIEEPPSKTTFVFLVKSREDIIPTIVSRCQTFKLSGNKKQTQSVNEAVFENYQNLNYDNAFDFSKSLEDFIKQNELKPELLLNEFLIYLKKILDENIENQSIYLKILNDIKIVNNSIKQLQANMSSKNVFDTMLLRIIRGY